MIPSDDAPALEAALHRRFRDRQVNKVNPRKEFFRLPLLEVQDALLALNLDVRWSLTAEARQYHETRAIEERLQDDAGFRQQWAASEAAYEATTLDDEDSPPDDLEPSQPPRPPTAQPTRTRRPTGRKATTRPAGLDSLG